MLGWEHLGDRFADAPSSEDIKGLGGAHFGNENLASLRSILWNRWIRPLLSSRLHYTRRSCLIGYRVG